MIPIPHPEKRWRPGRRYLTPDYETMPCAVCERPVRIEAATRWLHVCLGGGTALLGRPEEDPECERGACLLYYPIGPDCLRRHPELRPYAQRPFAHWAVEAIAGREEER